MSNIVIEAKNLSKIYKLYFKKKYRLYDMLGLLSRSRNIHNFYKDFSAIQNINLSIREGEKVAIIGRNGAGKSTFLKLVTNVIEPTTGTLEVRGETQALLQIGTGFHPDFTGKENVLSYLSYLGITGGAAERKYLEIVEFAELEEYIEQPVKTYSTGMAMRLMFAASTIIEPKLLVIDEVLGVGDAYFAKKSFDRIEQLCQRNNTTLLLVSHDIYTAARICDRMIWFDRGEILIDSDPVDVLKAYENSIRLQEENRLRVKTQQKLAGINESMSRWVLIEVSPAQENLMKSPIYFSNIRIVFGEYEEEVPILDDPPDPSKSHIVFEGSSWGELHKIQNRVCREMMSSGSIFKKALLAVKLDKYNFDEISNVSLKISACTERTCELRASVFFNKVSVDLTSIVLSGGAWESREVSHVYAQPSNQESKSDNRDHRRISAEYTGSGGIEITDIRMLNEFGAATNEVHHGKKATFEIHYRLLNKKFDESPDFCIVLFRAGTNENICRYLTRDLHLNAQQQEEGIIYLTIDSVILGEGAYSVTSFVAESGYLSNDQHLFYSLNPRVYLMARDVFEFNVRASELLQKGTVFVQEGGWEKGGIRQEETEKSL